MRRAAILWLSLLATPGATGCALITGSTDGYHGAASDAAPSGCTDAGDSGCSSVACATSAECGDAGAVCCLVYTPTGGVGTVCQQGPCALVGP